ncbi:glycosyltransferase [Psychromonas sp. KJ10-10]|uniref:glycosyltransferase n=1 Tax=Psychromonas sp. KJ10-10 TaxID=3391823 RepID=UPI0039B62989
MIRTGQHHAPNSHKPWFFGHASLLKWKGLETLLTVLSNMPVQQRPKSHICYIQPKQTQLPVSSLNEGLAKVNYYPSPKNLDQIRASANIFVSTSHQEPFGLSILEALAAGQCVLIPSDGAYWDNTLVDDINCIKYHAGDVQDLQDKLTLLCADIDRVTRIGQQGMKIASGYRASEQFLNIQTYLAQATAIQG